MPIDPTLDLLAKAGRSPAARAAARLGDLERRNRSVPPQTVFSAVADVILNQTLAPNQTSAIQPIAGASITLTAHTGRFLEVYCECDIRSNVGGNAATVFLNISGSISIVNENVLSAATATSYATYRIGSNGAPGSLLGIARRAAIPPLEAVTVSLSAQSSTGSNGDTISYRNATVWARLS
jgi:hypothetical protein